MRQLVCPPVQFAINDPLVFEDYGSDIRGLLYLEFKQFMDASVFRKTHGGAVPFHE
jgi:hypothetical protein